MPVDSDTPLAPGWWLAVLGARLADRRAGRSGNRFYSRDTVPSVGVRPGLDLLAAYRRGDPPLREDIHSSWAAPFRRYVRMGRLNFAGKLVSPTANRMGLRGFRTAAADDEDGDTAARSLMRRNGLALVAREVHDDMLTFGEGLVLCTPPDAHREWPLATAESPLHCITAHDPQTGVVRAGLKTFTDEWTGEDLAYLYLPGQVMVATRPGPDGGAGRGGGWEWDPRRFDDVPGGAVPLVRFRNARGVGEFEEHLDHLDRINDKLFNEWWITKIQAFRQRAIERGRDSPDGWFTDEGSGGAPGLDASVSADQVASLFVSSPDALWDLPPGARLWESSPVDVGPLVNSIQKELQWLAAAADKPLSSLNPDAANQTAEGATNQKEEHLYQVMDRRDRAEGAWAVVMSLLFGFAGDPTRSPVDGIEVLWVPMELYSLAQKAQAASLAATTLPVDAVRRDIYQYDPAEIPELRVMDGRGALFGGG